MIVLYSQISVTFSFYVLSWVSFVQYVYTLLVTKLACLLENESFCQWDSLFLTLVVSYVSVSDLLFTRQKIHVVALLLFLPMCVLLYWLKFTLFRKYGQEISETMLNGVIIECKFWEESATIFSVVQSGQMVYPCSKKVILQTREVRN